MDDDTIVMIRDDAVIAKLKEFITKNELEPSVINNLFEAIYVGSWPYPKRPHPTLLLFEETFVDDFLKQVDVSKYPKIVKEDVEKDIS